MTEAITIQYQIVGVKLTYSIRSLRTGIFSAFSLALSFWLSKSDNTALALLPSLTALLVVLTSRSALLGLLIGASCGAIIIADGSVIGSVVQLAGGQLWPILNSPWKLCAMLFTLIMGGFVALVEASGGLQSMIKSLLKSNRTSHKRMQTTTFLFGLLVFFDGLANTMLIGRMLRSAADRCGVSREKLAYLADTTGSAVACLAFISTWIAFQLSMIREGFELAGQPNVSTYKYFFKSIPANYYCWFALALALVCIWREYNPGTMGLVEAKARQKPKKEIDYEEHFSHWSLALLPITALAILIPVSSYLIGTDAMLPLNIKKFAVAYEKAESFMPHILVASSLLASLVAGSCYLIAMCSSPKKESKVSRVFFEGVRNIARPVCVLIAAWMLGAAISQLDTATLLSQALDERLNLALLPASIFLLGALISFSTGSSWATMGVLMPLAIPIIFTLHEGQNTERDTMIVAAIGAVFSGAVFGDHCSPFSDTTLVASIAAEVEPLDHVRTQFPFALITAVVALLVGFLPLGFGASAWIGWILGLIILCLLPTFRYKKKITTI